MVNREQIKTASGLNVLAGVWLILSPFILGFSGTPASTNAIIVGIVVGILALIRSSSPESAVWLSWINIVLGIWLILSSFIMGVTVASAIWNSIILGVIVLVLAAWSSSATSRLTTT